jgi:NaMN:DMB phosphoribosyltransferase
MVQAINQMEDFSIFGTKWQLEAAARNLEEVKHG